MLPPRNPLCQLTAGLGCPGSTRRSLGKALDAAGASGHDAAGLPNSVTKSPPALPQLVAIDDCALSARYVVEDAALDKHVYARVAEQDQRCTISIAARIARDLPSLREQYETAGSAAAPAARCKKRLRWGSLILNLPSHHSITSSARARSIGGISRPSAWAVVRLRTRSNLVGCSTGMSAGFAPRRILST